ncbi:MAG: Hpt domain-containing protein [Chitinophagales bacterium]
MTQLDNPLNINIIFDDSFNDDTLIVKNEDEQGFGKKALVHPDEGIQGEKNDIEDESIVYTETVNSSNESLFDPKKYLEHLAEMFNHKEQYMMEMVEILLQQIPETLQKMETAMVVENWDEIFAQSHRIKSTFRIAGLKRLVVICIAIEGRTRIIAPEELQLVPDLFEQFKSLSRAEIPNLEASLKYLQNRQEKQNEESNDNSSFTFPL